MQRGPSSVQRGSLRGGSPFVSQSSGVKAMSNKSHEALKQAKKKPQHTAKEKRAAKRAKKQAAQTTPLTTPH